MNNNFQDYNEKEYNNEEKKQKRFKLRNKVTLFIAFLILCFIATYFIVDNLNDNNSSNIGESTSKTTLYNNTKSLDDEMTIVLKVDGVVENSETLKEFKTANDIENVNEQFLVDYYTSKGYTVESLSDKRAVLNKEEETTILEPNKYYLGEKDGYFAIYKTDENGKAFIEDDSDIYTNSRMVNTIPTIDQQEIKSFKLQYDTKDEVKEILSGYIS